MRRLLEPSWAVTLGEGMGSGAAVCRTWLHFGQVHRGPRIRSPTTSFPVGRCALPRAFRCRGIPESRSRPRTSRTTTTRLSSQRGPVDFPQARVAPVPQALASGSPATVRPAGSYGTKHVGGRTYPWTYEPGKWQPPSTSRRRAPKGALGLPSLVLLFMKSSVFALFLLHGCVPRE